MDANCLGTMWTVAWVYPVGFPMLMVRRWWNLSSTGNGGELWFAFAPAPRDCWHRCFVSVATHLVDRMRPMGVGSTGAGWPPRPTGAWGWGGGCLKNDLAGSFGLFVTAWFLCILAQMKTVVDAAVAMSVWVLGSGRSFCFFIYKNEKLEDINLCLVVVSLVCSLVCKN
jgi:hypothetical protein